MIGKLTQSRVDACRAPAGFAARLGTIALALLLPMQAPGQTGSTANGNPRLASLGIEIWPEYDRPAALVILKGTLAEGVKLPASIALRVPAASGDDAAVAYSTTADGNLLNLPHERASSAEMVTLKFATPQRFFHVEFYAPIAAATPARSFRYEWPGDLAAEHVTLVVQEPASASDVATEPNLDGTSTGQDGLRYRTAELGPIAQHKTLPITVRYTKADARPSTEILKLKTSDASLPAAVPAQEILSTPGATAASGGLPYWAMPLAALVLLGLLGAALVLWWWRHASALPGPTGHGCVQCGAALVPGNRFCGNCGAPVV